MSPLCEVYPTVELYRQVISVREETGYSFFDSLIVATALSAGCGVLHSEDLHDGQNVQGLKIKNPF